MTDSNSAGRSKAAWQSRLRTSSMSSAARERTWATTSSTAMGRARTASGRLPSASRRDRGSRHAGGASERASSWPSPPRGVFSPWWGGRARSRASTGRLASSDGSSLCAKQPVERPVQQELQTSLARSNRSLFG